MKRKPLNERPSYWLRPALERIGRKWRALYGENIQDGVAGFGDTPDEAFADFDKRWFTHRVPSFGSAPLRYTRASSRLNAGCRSASFIALTFVSASGFIRVFRLTELPV